MGGLFYFSSPSGNTHRFISRLGLSACRIPYRASEEMIAVDRPFVLISPTYSDGEGRGAVHKQVIRFLNNADTRKNLRGIIATGNRNFGQYFAHAGDVISAKCGVPLLYRFELSGTETDIARVRAGLDKFWTRQPLSAQ
ncbi:class Ib ribonucleoside-diphosphate reductase assembly flavoprotein NrdI [Qingshengfaniella alkalisoli]|uniref:Protein NrdI n=1 Tax=Qingshengfaniella alkalisoli TaxID=2599296 RepID=A0A5B8J195_9RHOB|nr:class Ib ribonucleoside-diphosphate reductase assembly flavoprotein NrdI [Qingshengfaniella alkalisoli]QDY71664.1 class Ib ribonucleoside-diphosphate reductase assembly flavoprotein NrdI [Qingshengfaniella alkalisoli]